MEQLSKHFTSAYLEVFLFGNLAYLTVFFGFKHREKLENRLPKYYSTAQFLSKNCEFGIMNISSEPG